MRLVWVGIASILIVGCSPQIQQPVCPKHRPSCAWHIANDESFILPSECESVAREFARMYIKDHPELTQ